MSTRTVKIILIVICALTNYAAVASTDESMRLTHMAMDLPSQKSDAAIELLTRAIAEDPRNAQAYFERAMALMNLDRDADAVADLSKALDIDPNYPGALDWRARAFKSLGDFESAARDCRLDLAENPDGPYRGMGVSPQQWADCAGLLVKADDPAGARDMLEEYFDDYSSRVTTYAVYETAPMRLLARLYIEEGEPNLALQFAAQAYASTHRVPTDILVFALALEASGDLARAREICAEAMAINDQMPGVQALYRRLED